MIVDRISAQPVRAAGCAHMKGVWHFSYDKSIVVSLQIRIGWLLCGKTAKKIMDDQHRGAGDRLSVVAGRVRTPV